MVDDTDNPCSWEVEAVGAWIQGYAQQYVELNADLIYFLGEKTICNWICDSSKKKNVSIF